MAQTGQKWPRRVGWLAPSLSAREHPPEEGSERRQKPLAPNPFSAILGPFWAMCGQFAHSGFNGVVPSNGITERGHPWGGTWETFFGVGAKSFRRLSEPSQGGCLRTERDGESPWSPPHPLLGYSGHFVPFWAFFAWEFNPRHMLGSSAAQPVLGRARENNPPDHLVSGLSHRTGVTPT